MMKPELGAKVVTELGEDSKGEDELCGDSIGRGWGTGGVPGSHLGSRAAGGAVGRAGRLRVRLMKKGANLGGGDTHGQLGRQNQEPLALAGGPLTCNQTPLVSPSEPTLSPTLI